MASSEDIARELETEAERQREQLARIDAAIEALRGDTPPYEANGNGHRRGKSREAIREMLVERGPIAQKHIQRVTGLNGGTVARQLQTLEADGIAAKTGERDGMSPIWKLT